MFSLVVNFKYAHDAVHVDVPCIPLLSSQNLPTVASHHPCMQAIIRHHTVANCHELFSKKYEGTWMMQWHLVSGDTEAVGNSEMEGIREQLLAVVVAYRHDHPRSIFEHTLIRIQTYVSNSWTRGKK